MTQPIPNGKSLTENVWLRLLEKWANADDKKSAPRPVKEPK